MKYLKQILIILGFTALGEGLARLIPFPIPAAIYGIALMLIALGTGLLKPHQVKETSDFLISIMPILYVAPAVKILQYWGLIAPNLAAICIITAASTVIVFAVSGLVTQWIRRQQEGNTNG